ncbi:deoxyribose-phosphate aldolase [Rhizobacter sp. SG703]|uniref:deoxyribose-phosphate aldolase n=1 Tax=Rhizobacter sp. SG703 TaxID=2587140 RepID=UPI00144897DB|nr:deoxyribose-phosphate aldolase [Rhizobacter sp. SG703]NKI97599.1 deoxyribose-phosphate aldolase [Rhizobacter sp. SG703]
MTTRIASTADAARLALRCLDLTSLKDDDTPTSIEALADQARTPHGAPAALCVYPAFVPAARRRLQAHGLDAVRVATVVNFPRGEAPPDDVAAQIAAARDAGADEIDTVFPWRALQAGDAQAGAALVAACRRACGALPLKVILETGELQQPKLIRQASEIALREGADFLKTSTGKVAVNATPQAVELMGEAIRADGARAGLKVAGGVSTIADVQRYLALASAVYGADRLGPGTLRFGASSLLKVLLATIDGGPAAPAASGY